MTVAVDAVVYFRISDPTMSVTNVEKVDQSTRLLAQTTLRNFLGTKNLSEILTDREEISKTMQVCVKDMLHKTRRLKSFPWDALVYRSIMAFYLNFEKLGKPERCVMLCIDE